MRLRTIAATALEWLADKVRGRELTYWPKESNPDEGCFAVNYIHAWEQFGKPCHWRLSWAHSPHYAMFVGPDNEIIPVNRAIRQEIESLRRLQFTPPA